MNAERAGLPERIKKLAANEAGRNIVRIGAAALIISGALMGADDQTENDGMALGLVAGGLGTTLVTGKRSMDEIENLVNSSEAENS